MSETPLDPNPDPKRVPGAPRGRGRTWESLPNRPILGRRSGGTSLVMLMLLWIWQDQLHQLKVKTIPYSQFKQYLAAGEVAECKVEDLEISGRIVPVSRPLPRRPAPRRPNLPNRNQLSPPAKRLTLLCPVRRLPARQNASRANRSRLSPRAKRPHPAASGKSPSVAGRRSGTRRHAAGTAKPIEEKPTVKRPRPKRVAAARKLPPKRRTSSRSPRPRTTASRSCSARCGWSRTRNWSSSSKRPRSPSAASVPASSPSSSMPGCCPSA